MIIPQKLFHRGKILRPMSSFPAWGSYERRVPRVWLWRSEGFDLQSFHRTEGNRDSTLGGCTPSLMCTKSQGRKAVTPKKTEPDRPALKGLLQRRGPAVARPRVRATCSSSSRKYPLAWAPAEAISPTKWPADSRIGFPQAKQPTG